MSRQLDVLYLLERVLFVEKAIGTVLNKNQLKGLHLQDRLCLQEAKSNRKNFKIKRKLNRLTKKIYRDNKDKNKETIQYSNDLKSIPSKSFNESIARKQTLNNCSAINDNNNRKNSINSVQNEVNNMMEIKYQFYQQQSDNSNNDNNEIQMIEQLYSLRQQGQRGQQISRRIWQDINRQRKRQICEIINSYKNNNNIQNNNDMNNGQNNDIVNGQNIINRLQQSNQSIQSLSPTNNRVIKYNQSLLVKQNTSNKINGVQQQNNIKKRKKQKFINNNHLIRNNNNLIQNNNNNQIMMFYQNTQLSYDNYHNHHNQQSNSIIQHNNINQIQKIN